MQTWSEITHDFGENWPVYVSMPIIAALIGWFTKLVAIRMMFRPHLKRGIGPLGWQGIIPKRAPQMVEVLCATLTGKLISAAEIVDRIDGDRLAQEIERPMHRVISEVVPRIAEEFQPTVWGLLPRAGQDLVVQRAQLAAPIVVIEFVDQLREHIDDVFSLQDMVTQEFLSDPDILESMFLDVGRREFAFIRRSGLVFGFFIGLVQLTVWALFKQPLMMPIFGLFTGWFTDWAALRLIFNPKEPKKYLGVVTWHGLFLKHRIPVSEEHGILIATRVLTPERLVRYLFEGPGAAKVAQLLAPVIEDTLRDELIELDRHLQHNPVVGVSEREASLRSMLGAFSSALSSPARIFAEMGLNLTEIRPMSRAAADDLVVAFPGALERAHDYLEESMKIRATMAEKMVQMTPEQFEGVLRPAFQADERTIIMIGAVLGFLVGELQVVLVEHLTHS